MDDPIGSEATFTASERYRLTAQNLARGETLRLMVTSGSMEPLLCPGDVVLAQPLENAPLRLGDIIVVQRGDVWVTHRVVRVNGCGYSTHGDSTWTLDEPVALADVVGQVVAVERGALCVDLRSVRWRKAGRLMAHAARGKLGLLGGRGQTPVTLGSAEAVTSGHDRWLVTLIAWPFQVFNRLVVWIMLKMG